MRMRVNTEQGDVEVRGTLLAQTSSRQFSHRHQTRYAEPGIRCSACRWTRVTIVRDDDPGVARQYAVVTEGFSRIPGEQVLGRVERTSSPLWVIQCLHRRNKAREEYLSTVARNALLMATQYDGELQRECQHRGIG